MKQFLSFVLKEVKHILRDKRTMLLLFGMPLVMMLLFGFAITNEVRHVRTLVVASRVDHTTQGVVERLAQSEYFDIIGVVATPEEAKAVIVQQRADMAVVFEPRVTHAMPKIQFITDATDPNLAQQWTAYATAVIVNGSQQGINLKMLYNPQMRSAYNFVPAIMGMLFLLVCTMMTSISIVREKERGTMELLLVSPTRPLMVVVAKMIPYLLLALGILTMVLLIARYVLEVPLAGSLGWIVAISAEYILLALSLGLLVSNVAKTQLVALLVSAMVLLMPIVMLSGMLFPIETMPEILQAVSATIPTRYYISAMRKLMIMGVGIKEVAYECMVLMGMLVTLLTLALLTFKKRLA